MKKSLFVFFASLSLICGLSFDAFAQNRPRGINKRQHNQQKRIYQGVKSGELTPREFFRLEKEQMQIRRMEKRFKSDDELTRRERARLKKELYQASWHI